MLDVNLEPITSDKNIIKNGFKNSTGWNLGIIGKSNHLFEPLTSTPNIGTSNKDRKIIIPILQIFFSGIAEKKIIKTKPIIT